jgi:hypothetical protein
MLDDLQIMGLYGNGLILIDESELVRRYNECLKDMGLKTTRKRKFHIDCMGWSPELAESFGDNYYLSRGEANPLAIILTPKQQYAPIYHPFHSFDWALMKLWFDVYQTQITEVTKYSGIWLDIDQEVESYQEPEDLLMVDDVIVRAKSPADLMQKVRMQKDLVRAFMAEEDAIKMTDISKQIISSAEDIGDMHRKHIVIGDLHFSDVCTFYTRAFGGTFVFCSTEAKGGDEYYVLNKHTAGRSEGVDSTIDRRILSKLESMGLINYELNWWKDQFYRLKIIRDSFLFDVLDEVFPDLDFLALNTARQKGIIQDITYELPVEYFELKRLIYILEKGKKPKQISRNILPFFAHPTEDVDDAAVEVLWHALALICDKRQVVRLFRQDKDEFYKAFESWKTPKRKWAISVITKYYQHRMMKI